MSQVAADTENLRAAARSTTLNTTAAVHFGPWSFSSFAATNQSKAQLVTCPADMLQFFVERMASSLKRQGLYVQVILKEELAFTYPNSAKLGTTARETIRRLVTPTEGWPETWVDNG
jgi:hypothetical protein